MLNDKSRIYLDAQDVLDALYKLLITEGIPEYIRSDNGSEFTAIERSSKLAESFRSENAYITPGSPFSQSNGKFLDADNMIKRRFNKVLEGARVTIIRFHDLRHTYCKSIIGKDLNVKYIQKQMGTLLCK